MTYHEARQMADEIAQDRDLWLRTLVEKELGISPDVTTNPVKDAMVMGLAFILGAAVPLVPHFFLTGGQAIGVSVGATLGRAVSPWGCTRAGWWSARRCSRASKSWASARCRRVWATRWGS